MREIGDIVREFERRRGEPLALATLVQTRGSSYRRPGARMLITREGKAIGSLSGGCLEEEVVGQAREVLRTGTPALMEFDTRRRFGCNGALKILVERVSDRFFHTLAQYFHARRPCLIAIRFTGDCGSRLVSNTDPLSDGEFRQCIEPAPQLLVIGEGPDSNALRAIAAALGWSVRLAESASELDGPFDEWTAAIIKTHNYGRDFAALRTLLPLDLRYIGLIGPRARREQLLGDLFDTGIAAGPDLFAPAGLDLGGDSPESIALAIVAEIQAVFAGGSRQSLRDRKTPIHAPRGAPAAASQSSMQSRR
ncbi:MAG: pucA [Chthoniobacteraceae bacterium]|nr:pucA [Chthoniobacteraceae bacterium]